GYGAILDHFPGQQGYNYVFMTMMGLALVGFLVASTMYRLVRRNAQVSMQPVAG
ncbi:MAG: MFS transporter, partial [Pseudomonas sp.]